MNHEENRQYYKPEEICLDYLEHKFGLLPTIEIKEKLIKYYKDDRVECVNIDGNHQSCFLFQDEDGKFAYIIPFKYNLKPTNDPADLQKESFITTMDMENLFEVYFSDHEGICNNAKEKFDKKTKETYLDCTAEQRK